MFKRHNDEFLKVYNNLELPPRFPLGSPLSPLYISLSALSGNFPYTARGARITGLTHVTVCPRSSYPVYIVTYYMKWVTTAWTHSSNPASSPFIDLFRALILVFIGGGVGLILSSFFFTAKTRQGCLKGMV